MQITRKPVGQCYRKGAEINRTPNTLTMVFVRYTMDHDSPAYDTQYMIHGISTLITDNNTPIGGSILTGYEVLPNFLVQILSRLLGHVGNHCLRALCRSTHRKTELEWASLGIISVV